MELSPKEKFIQDNHKKEEKLFLEVALFKIRC